MTVCPTLYWGDSAEFAVVVPLLDIPHPTGYPLYALLGKLFSLLPLGALALRVNLLGSLAGAIACALVYLIVRQLRMTREASALGACLFAVSRELWEQSTVAEVYSLHAALTGAVLLAALRLRANPTGPRFTLLAALLGLSFTNHLTTLWTVPAIAWLVLSAWRPSPRQWAIAACAFAGSLGLYLYLPIRSRSGPLFNYGEPGSLRALIEHVTGQQFHYRMFMDSAQRGLFDEAGRFASLFADQFTPWLSPLVAAGAITLWLRDRRIALGLALLVVANLAFTLNYSIPDKSGYYLPIYLVAALALAQFASWLAARRRWLGPALFLLAALPAALHYRAIDKSGNRSLPDLTHALLAPLPPDSLVIAEDQELFWSLSYEQLFEGENRDKIVVNDYLLCLPWYIHHLRRQHPSLAIPPSVDELLTARRRDVDGANGSEIGPISRRYSERIAAALIDANLEHRRVFRSFHDVEEHKQWLGYSLVSRGLAHEVLKAETAPHKVEPWSVDYPDPSNYRRTEINDVRWRHVAAAFAASCNRDGIALIAAGRYAEARTAFERALAYNADQAQAELNLGVLFGDYLHDRTQRDEHWHRFLALAPADRQADAIRRALTQ